MSYKVNYGCNIHDKIAVLVYVPTLSLYPDCNQASYVDNI